MHDTQRQREAERKTEEINQIQFFFFILYKKFYKNKTLSKKSEKLKILIKYDNKQRGQCGPSLL